ncbi:MAG: family 16 glycoside hydrolase [Bacteroidota bacterium]
MKSLINLLLLIVSIAATAQINDLNDSKPEGVNVTYSRETYKGKYAIKVVPTEAQTEAKFAKLNGPDFKNGVIEVEVAGMRAKEAGAGARGFVGLAFRISEDNSQFECFYIRPTNGRAEDQERRNHAVQYFSYPDYPWHRLRKETSSKYETYADLVEGEWTKLRIEVTGDKARLFVNGAEQPTLIVNDLKLGGDNSGKIGFWVGPGTEAYFHNLTVKKE